MGLKAELQEIDRAVLTAALQRALAAAAEFEGATAPNPPVGCVLLDAQGNVLASFAHQRAGTAHAEAGAIAACRAAGTAGRIHTVVVTLEPCNHSGRTPPCVDAILATPARQVWIGARDPNPHVAGGGAARLAAAGLQIGYFADIDADAAARAARLIGPFGKRARSGLPWVTVKQALDAGGGMIPPPGRKTFTSPPSLRLAHELRRRADAIVTGSGTVLADLPEFTVRHVPDFTGKRRSLVILDRRGRVPESYLEAARRRGFAVSRESALRAALARLGAAGALEVLVEAGPTLTDAILTSGDWDEHVVISAGAEGQDSIAVHAAPARKGLQCFQE